MKKTLAISLTLLSCLSHAGGSDVGNATLNTQQVIADSRVYTGILYGLSGPLQTTEDGVKFTETSRIGYGKIASNPSDTMGCKIIVTHFESAQKNLIKNAIFVMQEGKEVTLTLDSTSGSIFSYEKKNIIVTSDAKTGAINSINGDGFACENIQMLDTLETNEAAEQYSCEQVSSQVNVAYADEDNLIGADEVIKKANIRISANVVHVKSVLENGTAEDDYFATYVGSKYAKERLQANYIQKNSLLRQDTQVSGKTMTDANTGFAAWRIPIREFQFNRQTKTLTTKTSNPRVGTKSTTFKCN